jgi:hypothetical protein
MPRWALLVLLSLAGSGCSVAAFAHDKTIGPISPAGHVHGAAAGSEFTVTDDGITARQESQWWFRPFPRTFIRRIGQPQSFWFAFKGIQAFFYGLSPVVMREFERGVEPSPEALGKLKPLEAKSSDVLERLGPPQLWIRRRSGSVMAYRADKGRVLAFWLGTPPFIDIFPGASNFSFRYLYRRTKPYKTTLFFDADERLLGLASNSARMNADQEGAERAEVEE